MDIRDSETAGLTRADGSYFKRVKKYFRTRENIIIFSIFIAAFAYGAWVRFFNLGGLSFWGDDGMTYLGTEAVLKHGYPLLPSGYINFHTILSFYIRAVPAAIFGLNEFALRLPSAIFGTLMIPLTFLFVREVLKNKYLALLSSVVIAMSVWQIEFSREARWYSEFNFFYLLSVYFFYLGFIRDRKVFKFLSVIFIILITFINSLGFSLFFLFIPLLIYKKREFFRKDTIISLVVVLAAIAGQVIHRNFWNVGLSFYTSTIQSDNIILQALGRFFSSPKLFFLTTFNDMFPYMFYVFLFGLVLVLFFIFFKSARNADEQFINIYSNKRLDIKLPFNIFFIYFIFFANTAFLGIGNMYSQQRYIFFGYVFFAVAYCWTLFETGRLISAFIKNRTRIFLQIAIVLVLFFLTVNHINPLTGARIPFRAGGDAVNPDFAFSNTVSIHPDSRGAGSFVNASRAKDELVISMDLLNFYPYAKRFDNWLWSGNLVSWQPYGLIDGIYYDYYFGQRVIRDVYDFYDIKKGNVWLHANRSKNVPEHISFYISTFLDNFEEYVVYMGDDGDSAVYYIPEEKLKEGINSFMEGFPSDELILDFEDDFLFDFSDEKNEPYLDYGWSILEPEGRWSDSELAYIYIDFKEKRDYVLNFRSKAFVLADARQTAAVFLNNNLVGKVEYTDTEMQDSTFIIPEEFIDPEKPDILRFVFKYTASPAKHNPGSTDARGLSVFFDFIKIK